MNKAVDYILAFVGGAAVSGLVTWKIAEKKLEAKYEAMYQEDLKSVKERFTVPRMEKKVESESKEEEKKDAVKVALDKDSITEYYKKIKPYAATYTNYSNVEDEEDKAHFEPRVDRIDVISPDDFDNEDEFEKQEVTLYADGTLADEDYTVLDPDVIVGKDNLKRMGEYEDGAMYVKNFARRVVYQILEDRRYYEDVTGKVPHLIKDEEDE